MANLVTRAEYKAYAGMSSNTQDGAIDSLLPKVSKLVRTMCKTELLNETGAVTDIFQGGTTTFLLSTYPIVAVSYVSYSSDYGKTYENLTQYEDWVYIADTQKIQCINGNTFLDRPKGYKVAYTAGYDGMPEDLKLAVFDLITYYIKHDSAVHSSRAPGGNTAQIEYITNTNVPAHIRRVIDLYTINYN